MEMENTRQPMPNYKKLQILQAELIALQVFYERLQKLDQLFVVEPLRKEVRASIEALIVEMTNLWKQVNKQRGINNG